MISLTVRLFAKFPEILISIPLPQFSIFFFLNCDDFEHSNRFFFRKPKAQELIGETFCRNILKIYVFNTFNAFHFFIECSGSFRNGIYCLFLTKFHPMKVVGIKKWNFFLSILDLRGHIPLQELKKAKIDAHV